MQISLNIDLHKPIIYKDKDNKKVTILFRHYVNCFVVACYSNTKKMFLEKGLFAKEPVIFKSSFCYKKTTTGI